MPRWLLGQGSRLSRVAEPTATASAVNSGALLIPDDPNLTLNLYAVNYADRPAVVHFIVDRLREEGRVERVFRQELTVPAGRAASARLDAPAGQTISISALLPADVADLVVPSATVVQFFPADAGTLPVLSVSPGDFVPTSAATADGETGPGGKRMRAGAAGARVLRTWGLLDVSQGVAAARPSITLIAQNTGAMQEEITVRIRRLRRELGRFEPVLERTLAVPVGSVARLVTDEPEGMTVEVAVAGSRRVVPTLLQQRRFLATGETELLARYGPEGLAEVPVRS